MAVRPGSRRRALAALALAALASGCERDPADVDCPVDDVGALVITELRGSQSGTDGYGEWVELYNASSAAANLAGLRIAFSRLDGSTTPDFVLRSRELEVGPGDHAVLYFDRSIPSGAAIDVISCSELIDRVIYRTLPSRGTLSFDGESFPPDHEANDDEGAWCVDAVEDEGSPENGIRGTPGERNRTCA